MPQPITSRPSALSMQSMADALDDEVRDVLRAKREKAYKSSVQAGDAVSAAIANSVTGRLFAQSPALALPAELCLQILSHLPASQVARFARTGHRAPELGRLALLCRSRASERWGAAPLRAWRAYIGSPEGFVAPCAAGPQPCPADPTLWAALRGPKLVLYRVEHSGWTELQAHCAPHAMAVRWTADGKALIWAGETQAGTEVWRAPAQRLAQAERLALLEQVRGVDAMQLHPHNASVMALGCGADVVMCQGAQSVARLHDVRGRSRFGAPGYFAWHPSGSRLAVSGANRICVVDTQNIHSPTISATLPTVVSSWQRFAWHPTAPILALRTAREASVWDVRGETSLLSRCSAALGNARIVKSIAFSPRGDTLVATEDDGLVFYGWQDDQLSYQRTVATPVATVAEQVFWCEREPMRLLLAKENGLWAGTMQCA